MKLRSWQSECIHSAIEKYKTKKHFLALATPGAGKTMMATVLAEKMYEKGKIDLVMCFSPSSIVANDFSQILSSQFNTHFDGTLGSMGDSFTYQSLNLLTETVWCLFDRYRVFVIFDEIHHCAGSTTQDANAWGQTIISKIKDKAAYTIALTGTPWRSDLLPIVLAEYCNESGIIQCDYAYGLKKAIEDNVCRIPQICVLDNDQITISAKGEMFHFSSFLELLDASIISYSEVVTNTKVIEQLLHHANIKLEKIRESNDESGGLIVASSIEHAWQIQLILKSIIGDDAVVVTSQEANANSIIQRFRNNNEKWIISVGMISEGTNVPRLQVCCYLSNVKTEMYFRQVLGRILRITSASDQHAFMFMPAAPKLVEFTNRVAEDIPVGLAQVKFIAMEGEMSAKVTLPCMFDHADPSSTNSFFAELENTSAPSIQLELPVSSLPEKDHKRAVIKAEKSNDKLMQILGRFNQKEIEIKGFETINITELSLGKINHYNSMVF